MPDQTDFHEFMNLRRAERHSAGLKAASERGIARSVPYDEDFDASPTLEFAGAMVVVVIVTAVVIGLAVSAVVS